jgi:hypothetical protein
MENAKKTIPLDTVLPEEVLRDPGSQVHGMLVEAVSFEAGSLGRLSYDAGGWAVASITLTGHTYFGNRATSAVIKFLEDSKPLEAPSIDDKQKRIVMYYPLSQYHAVADVLRGSKCILCVYWESPVIDQRGATLHTFDNI